MALKKDFTFETKYGTETVVNDCYIKVITIDASKNSGNARIGFMDKENGKILEEIIYPFPVNLDGNNFISQVYEHLKTLPEFCNSVDC